MLRLLTRKIIAACFAAMVVANALLYWAIWNRHPDYFVVQQELNLYPFDSVESLLWSGEIRVLPAQFSGLGELSEEASDLLTSADQLRAAQAKLKENVEDLERKIATASRELERNRSEQIEEYKRKEMGPFEQRRRELVGQITETEKRVLLDPSAYDPLRVAVADLRVQLAQHDYQMSQKYLDLATRILDQYGRFAKVEDIDQWRRLDQQADDARAALQQIYDKSFSLRQRAAELLAQWRGARVARLGMWDFLYFSLGVSTTTTFGDIVPNHRFVRSVVSVQLMMSIILMGLFVNSLSADLTARRSTNAA